MSLSRVMALVVKEIQDLRRNGSILAMLAVAPGMTLLWSKVMNFPPFTAATIGILFAVIMVGTYTPAMMLAEEKEKNTLRVLMLSPATPTEILLGKGLVTLLGVLVATAIIMPISGAQAQNLPLFLLTIIAGTVFVIMLGFIIGLLSPNQMATGYIGMPIYIVLLLFPVLGQEGGNVLSKIAKFIPSNYIGDGVFKALKGAAFSEGLMELGILSGSALLAVILFVLVYKRKEIAG